MEVVQKFKIMSKGKEPFNWNFFFEEEADEEPRLVVVEVVEPVAVEKQMWAIEDLIWNNEFYGDLVRVKSEIDTEQWVRVIDLQTV